MNIISHYRVQLRRIFTLALLSGCINVSAQVVNIPDPNFKAALVNNAEINTNGDEEIQVSEAESFDGWMNVNGKHITDLTGLEFFTSLVALNCSNNYFDSIDVSANTNLKSLWCSNNGLRTLKLNSQLGILECKNNLLTSLDLSVGSSIRILQCNGNQLTTLDVTGQPDLRELIFTDNELTNLDVSANAELRKLLVGRNLLTSLDVTNNGRLGTLHCYGNQLTELDVTNQPSMFELECYNNQLTDIDLSVNRNLHRLFIYNNELSTLDVSESLMNDLWCFNNKLESVDLGQKNNLKRLRIAFNQLTELDVSGNANLEDLDCRQNQLISLNVKNGNYQNVVAFRATNNPGLSCIEVDDVTYAEVNWRDHVDAGVEFDISCEERLNFVYIPDPRLKNALLTSSSINLNGDAEIQHSEAAAFTGQINVNSLKIEDMTGIEAFTKITDLRVHNNRLTSLDVSANIELRQLHCQKNQLTSLDISGIKYLYKFRFFSNQLTDLNAQNGNYLPFYLFDGHDNNLTCIQVSDVDYMETRFQQKVDPGVVFSTDCSGGSSADRISENTAPTDIQSIELQESIVVGSAYPNPFSNHITVLLDIGQPAPLIQVFDLMGGVYTPDKITFDERQVIVELSHLRKGVYILQVDQQRYRIVKE